MASYVDKMYRDRSGSFDRMEMRSPAWCSTPSRENCLVVDSQWKR